MASAEELTGQTKNDQEENDDDRKSDDDDRDDEADDSERQDRFVETDEHPEFLQSREYRDLKPYYNGNVLDDRNAEMRKSIYYIRQHWDEYDKFIAALKQLFLSDETIEFKDKVTENDFETLMSKQRNWMTEQEVKETEPTYEAIRMYTSDEGYKRIYRLCNHVFRDEKCLVSVEEIRSVVFLIELLNIDLYNYCLRNPDKRNFQGTVYRGMVLDEVDFAQFKTLRDAPIHKRNIAVPLVLFSASSKLRVARRFINQRMKEAEKVGKLLHPIIYKINIIGLKPKFITHFKTRFPDMTLTSMGAVDIHKISRHPREWEVLLRGPYTLILNVYEDQEELVGRSCSVLEALVITSNRDHITTSQPGPEDDLARQMYGAMVTVARGEYAVNYYRERGLKLDEAEYQGILDEGRQKLESLWNL